MIGFAIFEKWEGPNYYLAEMAILPEYQKQGIGKRLVFSIFDRDETVQKILLVSEKGNTLAQSFYEKIRFRRSFFRLRWRQKYLCEYSSIQLIFSLRNFKF